MVIDPVNTPSVNDEKFQMHVDTEKHEDVNHLLKSGLFNYRQPRRLSSLIYPILFTFLLILGIVLIILTVNRRNTCLRQQRQQQQQAETIMEMTHTDNVATSIPCVKVEKVSSCVCPASFVRSVTDPKRCISSHSRCLSSTCKTNPNCACHQLSDPIRCRSATRDWIEHDWKASPVERLRTPATDGTIQYSWVDHFSRQLERLLVDTRQGEHLFLSADRRTGIAVDEHDDDYLLKQRWTKIETNTTRQHIVYTQLNPQSHSCRMSSLLDDGSVTHGPIHTCPGSPTSAPYFLGVACRDVLVLWHGGRQFKVRRQEGWTMTRHHFEGTIPRTQILLDPFHRYYSMYDDMMIEIKNLNGDVLAQTFTDIVKGTRFEFVDERGTLLVANQTHMQFFRSTDNEAWLDF